MSPPKTLRGRRQAGLSVFRMRSVPPRGSGWVRCQGVGLKFHSSARSFPVLLSTRPTRYPEVVLDFTRKLSIVHRLTEHYRFSIMLESVVAAMI
jgi:hypothetical protein